MAEPAPRPDPALLLLAAAELDRRADCGAFRDRMGEMQHTWEAFRRVAVWLRREACQAATRG